MRRCRVSLKVPDRVLRKTAVREVPAATAGGRCGSRSTGGDDETAAGPDDDAVAAREEADQ